MDRESIVEADQEMLADWLDFGDGAAREPLEGVRPRDGYPFALEGGAQSLGRAPDRVAFGHRESTLEAEQKHGRGGGEHRKAL